MKCLRLPHAAIPKSRRSRSCAAKEVKRMRSLDRYAEMRASLADEQRLDPSPSWIKLCPPRSVLPHTTEMIHGMCFSRRQFESLCDDGRLKDGRGGALRCGYKNVRARSPGSSRATRPVTPADAAVLLPVQREVLDSSVKLDGVLIGGILWDATTAWPGEWETLIRRAWLPSGEG